MNSVAVSNLAGKLGVSNGVLLVAVGGISVCVCLGIGTFVYYLVDDGDGHDKHDEMNISCLKKGRDRLDVSGITEQVEMDEAESLLGYDTEENFEKVEILKNERR